MTCPVAGCLRPKAHSAPLFVAHWTQVSLELRMHWRNTRRLLDAASATAGITDEDRERFAALDRQVLDAIVLQTSGGAHGKAA